MDLAPRGDTTWAESSAPATKTVIDERIQFGALGARQAPNGGVEFGFWFPGTTSEFGRGPQTPPASLSAAVITPSRQDSRRPTRSDSASDRATPSPAWNAMRGAGHGKLSSRRQCISILKSSAARSPITSTITSSPSTDRSGVPFLLRRGHGKSRFLPQLEPLSRFLPRPAPSPGQHARHSPRTRS